MSICYIITEIELVGNTLDLHNSFNCRNIEYAMDKFIFDFSDSESLLRIVFTEVEILKMQLPFKQSFEGITLDNMYRGRFEVNSQLADLSPDSKGCIYIEFYEGQSLEFLCKAMIIDLI